MALPVQYEFIPFETSDGQSAGSYDDLVYQIFLGKYDAVVGDVTITANRSRIRSVGSGASRKQRIQRATSPASRHGERVNNNLARFVLTVWMLVVLVLQSSYTASLSTMLTADKLGPTVRDIKDLLNNGGNVGYQQGSFVDGFLKNMRFNSSKFRNYSSFKEYEEALSKEAFPKGSPLAPEVSKAILKLVGRSLTLDSFKGLFVIAGASSCLALIIFLSIFLCENREILVSNASLRQKLVAMAKSFDEEREKKLVKKKTDEGESTRLPDTWFTYLGIFLVMVMKGSLHQNMIHVP
ncbi:unnamed protein product [Thlaspi arvense]|uniref:Ionotropic glutamate receptor C-terminal domain-containing protein n=1 Tax=Thlaspi arvense TaxID=13288 RepID=A0AAU9RSZ1_THLAR|nr:unnamed protein product [Thlaspi arvense]